MSVLVSIQAAVLHGNSDLSQRLNLTPDEGEKWIVNLIRETRMGADAKIDLEKVCSLLLIVARLLEGSRDAIEHN